MEPLHPDQPREGGARLIVERIPAGIDSEYGLFEDAEAVGGIGGVYRIEATDASGDRPFRLDTLERDHALAAIGVLMEMISKGTPLSWLTERAAEAAGGSSQDPGH